MRTRENVEDAIVQAVLALGGGVGRDADGVTAAIRVHGGVVGVSVHWADADTHEAPSVPSSRHHDGPADKLTGLHPPCRNPATGRCFCGEAM